MFKILFCLFAALAASFTGMVVTVIRGDALITESVTVVNGPDNPLGLNPRELAIKQVLEGKRPVSHDFSWLENDVTGPYDYEWASLRLNLKLPGLKIPSSRREFLLILQNGIDSPKSASQSAVIAAMK